MNWAAALLRLMGCVESMFDFPAAEDIISQMAIADAVLQQLMAATKCKTLFITHYPLVASSLERQFPHDVENLHMDYGTRTRIDGTREVTFLYRLVKGMVSGKVIDFLKFGLEY
jgi:hypothetical protein